MVEAGESEEDIAGVIQHYGSLSAQPKPKEATWGDTAITGGLRIATPIVGGLLGIAGGPAGVIAGGAGGGLIGETGAQAWEKYRGLRSGMNPTQIAVQTGLSAIPIPGMKAGATIARAATQQAAKGGALGLGSTVATELAETGQLPTAKAAVVGTGLGAAMGGGFGALAARGAKGAKPPVAAKPIVPVPHGPARPPQKLLLPANPNHAGTQSDLPAWPAKFAVNSEGVAAPTAQADKLIGKDGKAVKGTSVRQAGPGASAVPAKVAVREAINPDELLDTPLSADGVVKRGGATYRVSTVTVDPPAIKRPPPVVVDGKKVPQSTRFVDKADAVTTRKVEELIPGKGKVKDKWVLRGERPMQSKVHERANMTDDVVEELTRIGDELESFPYIGRTRTVDANGEQHWVAGAGGAPIYDSIGGGTRGEVLERIRDYVQTGKRTAASDRAVDVARRRIAGDPHVPKPMIPTKAEEARAAAWELEKREAGFMDDVTDMAGDEAAQGARARQPGEEGVDVLPTGEAQPRLPVAGAVRDMELPTPPVQQAGAQAQAKLRALGVDDAGIQKLEREAVEGGVSSPAEQDAFWQWQLENHKPKPDVWEDMAGKRGGPAPGPTSDKLADLPAPAPSIWDHVPGRLANESGAINPALAVRAGGAVAGGAIGGTEGETWQERVRNAALGAAAGAAVPAALGAAGRRAATLTARELAEQSGSPMHLGAKGGNVGVKTATSGRYAVISNESNPLGQTLPAQGKMGNVQKTGAKIGLPHLNKMPQSQRVGLHEILEAHGGFEGQRRGVQPHARSEVLSQQIAVDLKQVLGKGKTLNTEEMRAYGNAVATLGDKIETLVQKSKATGLTPLEMVQLDHLRTQHLVVFTSLSGASTEAGRALQALGQQKRILDLQSPAQAMKAAGNLKLSTDDFIKGWLKHAGDPVAQYRFTRDSQKLTWGDTIKSYMYANMLSGVATHERNIAGNFWQMMINPAADLFTLKPGKAAKQVVGMATSLGKAKDEAIFALKEGFSRNTAHADMEHVHGQLKGGGKNPFNWPGRALESMDVFFKTLTEGAELARGTSPEEAVLIAKRTMFQGEPGKIAKGVTSLRNNIDEFTQDYSGGLISAGTMVLPFVRIAANMAKAGAEFGPAGFLISRKLVGRERELVRQRAMLGTMVGGAAGALAYQGWLSGNGPSDPADRMELEKTGWKPRSIRMPNGSWVSYENWGPAGLLFSTVANGFEAQGEGKLKGTQFHDQALDTVMRIAADQTQRSFFQGFSDILEAITPGNERSAKARQFWSRTASGFVPFSGALRTAVQVTDDTIRKPETWGEGVAMNIPGMADKVAPRLTVYGEDAKRPGGAVGALTRGLWQSSPQVDDPVTAELQTLGIHLGTPDSENLKEIKGDRAAEMDLKRGKGREIRKRVETIMALPHYQTLSKAARVRVMETAIKGGRRLATAKAKQSLVGRIGVKGYRDMILAAKTTED